MPKFADDSPLKKEKPLSEADVLDQFSKELGIDNNNDDDKSISEVINDGAKKSGLINFAVDLMRESGFSISDSDIEMVNKELAGPVNSRTLKRTINRARKTVKRAKKKKKR